MKITTDLIQTLAGKGIEPDTHHMTLKSAVREALDMDEDPTKEEQDEIRGGLEALAQKASRQATLAAEDAAHEYVEEMKQTGPNYWNRVIEPTDWNEDGEATRVLIKCTDPQVDGDGESVCTETREIAVQDLFQVYRCESCQDRAVQIYRNRRARERRRERREQEA